MADYSEQDLTRASVVIASLIHKCEKSLEKITGRTAQQSLLINRIQGLQIALALIEREIKNKTRNG